MSNNDFYMKSSDGITIKKSYGSISMTLIAEVSNFDNNDVAVMLLEDVKKDLIAYLGNRKTNIYPINGNISSFKLNMPEVLRERLATRAESEKCSLDALCVYIFSYYLSGAFNIHR